MRASLLLLFAALAGCSPGDRGWCRHPGDYAPAGAREAVRAGALAVNSSGGEGGRFFAELLAKDMAYAGYFSGVSVSGGRGRGYVLEAGEPALEASVSGEECRVAAASAEVALYRDGRLLLRKEYGRRWEPAVGPSCERAWESELPDVMQEIRADVLSAAR